MSQKSPPPVRQQKRPDDLTLYAQDVSETPTETSPKGESPKSAQQPVSDEQPLSDEPQTNHVQEPVDQPDDEAIEPQVEQHNEQIESIPQGEEEEEAGRVEEKLAPVEKPTPAVQELTVATATPIAAQQPAPTPIANPKTPQEHQEKHVFDSPQYPIGPDGKRDFSKSPAELLYPEKEFDSKMTISYKNVSCKVQVPMNPNEIKTFISPFVNLYRAITTKCASCETRDFYRIKDANGIIRPGTMTLVLSPPGHGKSSYLRALANRIPFSEGRVAYNGRDFDQAAAEGCDLKKLTQYIDQVDTHLPVLTVEETLDFAHKLTSVKYDPQRVEDAIALLGLEECRNTILGNALIRGVSGGQKKRVTIGELLVSDASTLFFDEFSNGLDSSTSIDIGKGLKKFCLKYNSSVVATLQQPTPELFALFDRTIIILEGQIVWDGPVDDVLPFFAAMGFNAPDDVDTADFLLDCLTQPRSVIFQQKQTELLKQKKSGKKSTPKPKHIKTSYGNIDVAPEPCITVEQMVDFYRTTPQWKEIKTELDETFPDNPDGTLGTVDLTKHEPLMPTPTAHTMYKTGSRLPAMKELSYVLEREFKLWSRNKGVLIPRIIMAILMSLLFGFLYFNVGLDEFILRLASLFICVSQVAFGNMIEIPTTVASNHVVKKQLAARFYSSWAEIVSQAIVSFPMSLIEGTIYGVMMYWMTNAAPYGPEFLTFWCLLIAQSFQLAAWFRFLTVIGKDVAKSQSMAGPSTGVFMVFAGLFITRSNIPNFMIWLYYIAPFSWTVRALSNNEFLSARYDKLVEAGTDSAGNPIIQRLGQVYLAQIDMFVGSEWILWAIIYLLGLTIFVIALHSWFLIDRHYEESIGTRRVQEAEIIDGEEDVVEEVGDQQLKAQVEAAAMAQAEHSRSNVNSSTGGAQSSTGGSRTSTMGTSALKTLRENLPFAPAWLSWSDVSYTVKVEKDKQMVDRVLLNKISGYAAPGRMLALMGASGAGKTTLLDVLAGLKNTGVVEGKILINGQPATAQLIAQTCGYVEQFDTLFSFSTVRETLLFAAKLRLPHSVSVQIKEQIVDEILDILDLTSMRDYIIGGGGIVGLSPAQRKRVSIGVELVANPAILFLDEPTTGLDSASAATVMKVVKRISRSGRSVIVTIHQPNSELFYMFDRLLLLGAGGWQIFFGTLGHRAKTFIEYLSRCPGVTAIAPRVNPASWMLVELGVGVASEKGDIEAGRAKVARRDDAFTIEDDPEWADLNPQAQTVQRFKKAYLQSDFYRETRNRLDVLESIEIIDPTDSARFEKHKQDVELANMKRVGKAPAGAVAGEDGVDTSRTMLPRSTVVSYDSNKAPIHVQFPLVFQRNQHAYFRNPAFLHSRIGIATFLSILFGLIYLNLEATDIASATSLIGACFMSVVFAAIGASATSLPVQFEARAAFYREKAGGYYNPLIYGPVQLMIEMLWCILSVFLCVIPAYFMIGLRHDAGVFFGYCLSTYVLLISYVTVSQLFASFTPNIGVAQVLQGSIFSLLNAFSGVSITYPALNNGFFQFLYRVFPNSHILEAIVMPQFSHNEGTMTYLNGSTQITEPVKDYVSRYLGWGFGKAAENLGWAVLFIGVCQILHFVFLATISHNKR